ncbi:hypothetical protein SAMN05443377_101147 [Propionibacterium cyclohexanicum]|uniref:Uncharacterized protein n=1 Tax=Propionibacterium cyclohexanicum TaxID=64702 RepID=A0A1H9PMF2_9ACTN|nr:hypothetical protein [Propionibacterium cyclohexanicum]SER49392.1 hypothetical protein SAMN05443377_101147 [Propionibacterium cyclohexanicum]
MATVIHDQGTELVEAVEALVASDWAHSFCDETRAEIARLKPQTDIHRERIRSVSFTVPDNDSAQSALEYRFGQGCELTGGHRRVIVWHTKGREVRLESNARGGSTVVVD